MLPDNYQITTMGGNTIKRAQKAASIVTPGPVDVM